MEMTKETTMMTAHRLSRNNTNLMSRLHLLQNESFTFDHNEKREVELEFKRRNAKN